MPNLIKKIKAFLGNNTTIKGCIDAVKDDSLTGWVYDVENPHKPNLVEVYLGDTLIKSVLTDIQREDVNTIHGVTGNHGFHVKIPHFLCDGVVLNLKILTQNQPIEWHENLRYPPAFNLPRAAEVKKLPTTPISDTNIEAEQDSKNNGSYSGLLKCHLDRVYNIRNRGYLIYGWMLGHETQYRSIECILNDQEIIIPLHNIPRTIRKDVFSQFKESGLTSPELGFIYWIPLDENLPAQNTKDFPSKEDGKTSNTLTIVLTDTDGNKYISTKQVAEDKTDKIFLTELFQLISTTFPQIKTIMEYHVGPAINVFWKFRNIYLDKAEIFSKCSVENNYKVSVIIPLYGRVDFFKYQLTLFEKDDFLKKHAELIYVLDDPSLEEEMKNIIQHNQPIFNCNFKVIYPGLNLGYAGANNLGSRYANTDFLLFLNSDVFPKYSGWLEKLLDNFIKYPEAGAIGPMLVYPDESIQHAGMQFMSHPNISEYWINDHKYKGLPKSICTQPTTFMVAAITGACFLIRKRLYDAVNGFDENYIYGDFEDSDLCLKLRERGLYCYLDPSIHLYHLERQSIISLGDSSWRANLTLYNCWRHTKKWNAFLKESTNYQMDYVK